MVHTDPSAVQSPKEHVSDVLVIHNTGEDGWALAQLKWDGEPVLAVRWNGGEESPLGNPQSRGIATWFVLPAELAAIAEKVFLQPSIDMESFDFTRAKLRPLPLRIWDGKNQGSIDDEWAVLAWDDAKGQLRLRNIRTDHFVVLYKAHIRRVYPDPVADAKNNVKNCVLELTVQVVFEDGNIRLEYGATAMRTIVERSRDFLSGMQRFERALQDRLGQVEPLTFRWNSGREFIPPPESIPVEVFSRTGRDMSATLQRQQLEDSANQINRPDVLQLIDRLADDLQPKLKRKNR